MFSHFLSCTYQPELPFGPVDSCPSHAALLEAAAKIPLGLMIEGQPPSKDVFDNPFIPRSPIAYLSHDFCKLDPAGHHVGGCSGPNPAIWRVVKDEKFTFVFPRDLGDWEDVPATVTKPNPGPTFRFSYRPTLDEFMSSRAQYRDDAVLHCDTVLDTQMPSRATHSRQNASKPTGFVVARGKSSSRLASRDDDMAVDSRTDTIVSPSWNTNPPTSSSSYGGHGDDDDDYELPVNERKARLPEKKPTKKQKGPGGTTTSRPALQETVNGHSRPLFACPFDNCNRVCSTRGDLERHLHTKDHKKPSVPCPMGCGVRFTRDDAAKRHANKDSCGRTKTMKSRVSA